MSQARILLFDSGMGGLTVARAVARQLPDAHLVYAADNAGFPYGAWKEEDHPELKAGTDAFVRKLRKSTRTRT